MKEKQPCKHTGFETTLIKATLYGRMSEVKCGNCGIVKRLILPEALRKRGGKP